MSALDKAKEYANNKSSSIVFTENHIKDYLAGYERALEDSHALEMLEMLEEMMSVLKKVEGYDETINEIKQLIKKATEI